MRCAVIGHSLHSDAHARHGDEARPLARSAGGSDPEPPALPGPDLPDVDGATEGAEAARALFAEHGWGGAWVDGIFGFHHFHSTSHEALTVVAGRAVVELGGPQGHPVGGEGIADWRYG